MATSSGHPRPSDELTEFHCPLCMDIPEGEVQQCINGHIFCADCLQAHRNSGRGEVCGLCPTCRVELGDTPIRSRVAEHAIQRLAAPCSECGLPVSPQRVAL